MYCEIRIFVFRALFISFGIAYNVKTNIIRRPLKPLRGPSHQKKIIDFYLTKLQSSVDLFVFGGYGFIRPLVRRDILFLLIYLYDFTVLVLLFFFSQQNANMVKAGTRFYHVLRVLPIGSNVAGYWPPPANHGRPTVQLVCHGVTNQRCGAVRLFVRHLRITISAII